MVPCRKPDTKRAEVRPSNLTANLVAFPVTAAAIGLALLFVRLMPHRLPLRFDPWRFALTMLACIVVHELVHAVVMFAAAGAPLRAFKFGFNARALMPYFHCRVPVRIDAYRHCTLGPFWVTIVAGAAVLALRPDYEIALVVGLCLGSCAGDWMLYLHLRPFGRECFVQDHHSVMGCDVYVRAAAQGSMARA